MRSRGRIFRAILTSIISFSLTLGQSGNFISDAAIANTPQSDPSMSIMNQEGMIDSSITLQLDGMRETKSYQGSNNGSQIILIRDIHAQEEAQIKIAKAIEQMNKTLGLTKVFLEGANGKVRTLLYESFPNLDVRRSVGREFIQKGFVTGAEYAAIELGVEADLDLQGVEEPDLYIRNFKVFRNVRNAYKDHESYFNSIDSWFDKVKQVVYNESMKQLQEVENLLQDKNMDLYKALLLLEGLIEQVNQRIAVKWDKIKPLQMTLEMSHNIDQIKLDKQLKNLLDYFEKQLVKEDMKTLVTRGLAFRLGKITADEYIDSLKNLYKEDDFDLRFPLLLQWKEIAQMQKDLNMDEIWQDLEGIVHEMKTDLALQSGLEVMVEADDTWRLLNKLMHVELIRKELLVLKQKGSVEDILSGLFSQMKTIKQKWDDIPEPVSRQPALDQILRDAGTFYELALERDRVLAKNAIENMGNAKEAVLITGGFHTDGIQSILEEHKISYKTLTPVLRTSLTESPYEKLMMDESYDLDQTEFSDKRYAWRNQNESSEFMLAVPIGDMIKALSERRYDDLEIEKIERLLEAGLVTNVDELNTELDKWVTEGDDGLKVIDEIDWDTLERVMRVIHRLYPGEIFVDLAELEPSNLTHRDMTVKFVDEAYRARYPGLYAVTVRYFERAKKESVKQNIINNSLMEKILARKKDSRNDRIVLNNFVNFTKPKAVQDMFDAIDDMDDDQILKAASDMLREHSDKIGRFSGPVEAFVARETVGRDDFHQVFFASISHFFSEEDFQIFLEQYHADAEFREMAHLRFRINYLLLKSVEIISSREKANLGQDQDEQPDEEIVLIELPQIVSIGGNSLLTGSEVEKYDPTIDEQFDAIKEEQRKNVRKTLEQILESIKSGGIITHGNGPETGVSLARVIKYEEELAKVENREPRSPEQLLPVVIAETQRWIADDIKSELIGFGVPEDKIVFIQTHVGVDPNDDVFSHAPTKAIGIKTSAPGEPDNRERVFSPKPKRIIELEEIKKAVQEGKIVIAVGGGGIPVDYNDYQQNFERTGQFKYVSAVIDKDFATAELIRELAERGPPVEVRTNRLIISTAVDQVYINWGTNDQQPLTEVTVEELEEFARQGHFEEGSMLPKVLSAIEAIRSGAVEEVIITRPENIANIDKGAPATKITRQKAQKSSKDVAEEGVDANAALKTNFERGSILAIHDNDLTRLGRVGVDQASAEELIDLFVGNIQNIERDSVEYQQRARDYLTSILIRGPGAEENIIHIKTYLRTLISASGNRAKGQLSFRYVIPLGQESVLKSNQLLGHAGAQNSTFGKTGTRTVFLTEKAVIAGEKDLKGLKSLILHEKEDQSEGKHRWRHKGEQKTIEQFWSIAKNVKSPLIRGYIGFVMFKFGRLMKHRFSKYGLLLALILVAGIPALIHFYGTRQNEQIITNVAEDVATVVQGRSQEELSMLRRLDEIRQGMIDSPQKDKVSELLTLVRNKRYRMEIGEADTGMGVAFSVDAANGIFKVNRNVLDLMGPHLLELALVHEAKHIDHKAYMLEFTRLTEAMGEKLGNQEFLSVENLLADNELMRMFQERLAVKLWPEVEANLEAASYFYRLLQNRRQDLEEEAGQYEASRIYFQEFAGRGLVNPAGRIQHRSVVLNALDTAIRGRDRMSWVVALHLESIAGHAPPFNDETTVLRILMQDKASFFLNVLYWGNQQIPEEEQRRQMIDLVQNPENPFFQYLFTDPLSEEDEARILGDANQPDQADREIWREEGRITYTATRGETISENLRAVVETLDRGVNAYNDYVFTEQGRIRQNLDRERILALTIRGIYIPLVTAIIEQDPSAFDEDKTALFNQMSAITADPEDFERTEVESVMRQAPELLEYFRKDAIPRYF
ncbi:MAG: hypothetical protein Q8Q33_07510, partial [Chlamydiota bacterium]|nr:hypothetical protein [Chlamydiota bacterium]